LRDHLRIRLEFIADAAPFQFIHAPPEEQGCENAEYRSERSQDPRPPGRNWGIFFQEVSGELDERGASVNSLIFNMLRHELGFGIWGL
jgi:hypothetical protein